MQVVFVGRLTDESFTFARVHGSWDGVAEGMTYDRAESLCHRMLAGAPPAEDISTEPAYADAALARKLGVTAYVGVPIRDAKGHPVGTLCGIDHGRVTVPPAAMTVLERLADVVGAHVSGGSNGQVVLRRTPSGWRVGADEEVSDITSAMVLADLLAQDLTPPHRPTRPGGAVDEVEALRTTVTQLEHALAARVVVEQAIGVLAERQRIVPRAAFEKLRKAARSRGRKVQELAREVVASAADAAVPLPPELAGRAGTRHTAPADS